MNNQDTLAALAANHYTARAAEDSDQVLILGAAHDHYYQEGNYATGVRTFMAYPTVNLAVLMFSIDDLDDPSPLAARFMDELVKLLTPSPRLLRKAPVHPAIRVTPKSVQALYQADTIIGMALREPGPYDTECESFTRGLRFADAARFARPCELAAASSIVPLDGSWVADRSPLNTSRTDLPQWSSPDVSPKLRQLVDTWVAAGNLREPEPFIEPAPTRQMPRPAGVPAPAPAYRDPRLPLMQRRSDGQPV